MFGSRFEISALRPEECALRLWTSVELHNADENRSQISLDQPAIKGVLKKGEYRLWLKHPLGKWSGIPTEAEGAVASVLVRVWGRR